MGCFCVGVVMSRPCIVNTNGSVAEIRTRSERGQGTCLFMGFSGEGTRRFEDPLQALAQTIIRNVFVDPSIGTIGQIFDSLQPSPTKEEFRISLLKELRWANRLLTQAIKHIDPENAP